MAGEFDDGVLRVRRVLGEAGVGYAGAWARLSGGNGEDAFCGSSGHGGAARGRRWPRGFSPWRRRARVSVEIGEGAREGGSGGGEWTRRVPGVSPDASRRRGRARGEGSVVGVLNQLGGIPPSSLEARGEEDDRGGAAGPAGGPRPGRQVGFF